MIPKHSIKSIEKIICQGEGIYPVNLHVPNKIGRIPFVRQIIMYFASEEGYTHATAAGYFGLDHACTDHSKKTIRGYCDVDISFRKKIERYRRQIQNTTGLTDNSFLLSQFMIPRQKLTGYKITTL